MATDTYVSGQQTKRAAASAAARPPRPRGSRAPPYRRAPLRAPPRSHRRAPPRWEAYLADHGIEKIFRDMTSELITAQPAAPVDFMIDYLRTTHGGADAKGSGSGGAQAKDAQYKDEGKDDDPPPDSEDEDDEGDYADFEPIKPQLATKKRMSIAAPKVTVAESWQPPVYEKSPETTKFLTKELSSIFFIKALTRKEIGVLVAAMKEITYEPGSDIIKQGEEGDMFYIVEDGICDITVEGVGKVMEIPCPSKEDPSVERRFFGELALLYDAPRAATVASRDEVKSWGLDRTTFKSILQETEDKKIMLYSKFIQSISIFKDLTMSQINTLCNSLTGMDYQSGDTIIKEGEVGHDFYIVETGVANCYKTVDGAEKHVFTVNAGDYFGELALVNDAPRQATVKAATPLSLVKIDRPTFKRMIGKLDIAKNYN